jgi:hypothetical protein
LTQPIQEPTGSRDVSGLDYRTRQLARRPPIINDPNTCWGYRQMSEGDDPLVGDTCVTNNSWTKVGIDGEAKSWVYNVDTTNPTISFSEDCGGTTALYGFCLAVNHVYFVDLWVQWADDPGSAPITTNCGSSPQKFADGDMTQISVGPGPGGATLPGNMTDQYLRWHSSDLSSPVVNRNQFLRSSWMPIGDFLLATGPAEGAGSPYIYAWGWQNSGSVQRITASYLRVVDFGQTAVGVPFSGT